jgi:hypothetical protein
VDGTLYIDSSSIRGLDKKVHLFSVYRIAGWEVVRFSSSLFASLEERVSLNSACLYHSNYTVIILQSFVFRSFTSSTLCFEFY